ncbi:uncharacterized protein LOC113518727 [Galleria mellonella]|uniref:Uncharacterized protein LOC113518727 n=1 Tax=Galleria mellonella TaxID=7137 RepID=A0A6J1WU65_GALME|nr:uncharacterized protein LOC113518727 [Galleria mellonella]
MYCKQNCRSMFISVAGCLCLFSISVCYKTPEGMYSTVVTIIMFNHIISNINCVTVNQYTIPEIISKTRTELTPILITCSLNDIVIISAPVIDQRDVHYYLYRPNGGILKLNITHPNYAHSNNVQDTGEKKYSFIVIKYTKKAKRAIVSPLYNYRVFSVKNKGDDDVDLFAKNEKEMNLNDFMIGPLGENDHGNWVLCLYYKDLNDEWLEMFQVITIKIIESVTASVRRTKSRTEDTFHFSFSYPIRDLTSCELTAPVSTYDRYYERDVINWDTCGYVIKNITKNDEGMWRIMGVGRIVYETLAYLKYT